MRFQRPEERNFAQTHCAEEAHAHQKQGSAQKAQDLEKVASFLAEELISVALDSNCRVQSKTSNYARRIICDHCNFPTKTLYTCVGLLKILFFPMILEETSLASKNIAYSIQLGFRSCTDVQYEK